MHKGIRTVVITYIPIGGGPESQPINRPLDLNDNQRIVNIQWVADMMTYIAFIETTTDAA